MISCVNEFRQLNGRVNSVNTKKASFVDFILHTLKKITLPTKAQEESLSVTEQNSVKRSLTV